ncbi:MAG: polymer-forming cytoskeletal protein [Bacteroidota bacterium]|jgi:cytoskeletal protein CcmA (bactofilin family)
MAMFQGNSGKKESPASTQGILNIIGQGTKLTGDLSSNGDIRIDGAIEGQIKVSQRLVIGNTGKVLGNIESEFATVAGHIKGNVVVKQVLELKPSARIDGDIIAGKVIIEAGAQFNGRCTMNSTSSGTTAVAASSPRTEEKEK